MLQPMIHRLLLIAVLGGSWAPGFAGQTEVTVAGGNLSGVIKVNGPSIDRDWSGFSVLTHTAFPGETILNCDSVNNEHLINALSGDAFEDAFTPRRDPCHLEQLAPNSARLTWRAEESSWPVDQSMTYTLEDNHIDLEFRQRFTGVCWAGEPGRDWVSSFFATYLNRAADKKIFFWGSDSSDGWPGFGWTSFGGDLEPGQEDFLPGGKRQEDGSVKWCYAPHRELEMPHDSFTSVAESPDKGFLYPFYFGLLDGDGLAATSEDRMVYILMFPPWLARDVQFSLYCWGENTRYVAWDWQYTVRQPKLDTWYAYRARIVYRPIASSRDVVEEYARFVKELLPDLDSFSLKLPEMPLPPRTAVLD